MNDLSQNLQELITQVQLIRNIAQNDKIGDFDISFLNEFDAILKNLKNDNNEIEFIDNIEGNMQNFLNLLINDLQIELQNIINYAQKNGFWTNKESDLMEIDKQLTNPNLSIEQINKLLDKRNEITLQ